MIFRRLFGGFNHHADVPAVSEPPHYYTRFGLEVGFGFNNNPPDLSDLKPRVVRMDTSTYPGANDAFLTSMAKQAIDVILITPYDYLRAPKTAYEAAVEAGTIAARNKGKVWAYEVLNEANAPSGSNGGSRSFDPLDYMLYLTGISAAIRQADPNARIISSGTSGVAIEWHREIARLGAAKLVDFVSFHPYGSLPSQVHDNVSQLASIWGYKPIVCTEFGDPNPSRMIAMHQALDGLVHTSILFTYAGGQYGLTDDNGIRRTSYAQAKALFAK